MVDCIEIRQHLDMKIDRCGICEGMQHHRFEMTHCAICGLQFLMLLEPMRSQGLSASAF